MKYNSQEFISEVQRLSEGHTQQEIARQLEVNQSNVSRMLAGDSRFDALRIRWYQMCTGKKVEVRKVYEVA